MKVAKWEIKRNLKNKTFLIGLFLTPLLILGFAFIGSLVGSDDDEAMTNVYIVDALGVYDVIEETANAAELDWNVHQADLSEEEAEKDLADKEDAAYIFVDKRAVDEGIIPVYTSEEIASYFMSEVQVLESPIKAQQMKEIGLSDEQLAAVSTHIQFEEVGSAVEEDDSESSGVDGLAGDDLFKTLVPGMFAGIILLSIIFAGMYIFQSASQEKKDKIAEIILSSITPGELMQGKIIGYFVLGLVQAAVLLFFAIPITLWKTDIPVFEYLFVPETLLLVFIAILGYLLFASLFVGIGATMADVSSAGNFQGIVMMLPFLPFALIGPVISDPSGLVAQIGTYVPFTTPGILLLRLTMLEEWPWIEIAIALVILIVSIWLFMKLAGKIFKVGILMYGKNATPKEIWKWLRA